MKFLTLTIFAASASAVQVQKWDYAPLADPKPWTKPVAPLDELVPDAYGYAIRNTGPLIPAYPEPTREYNNDQEMREVAKWEAHHKKVEDHKIWLENKENEAYHAGLAAKAERIQEYRDKVFPQWEAHKEITDAHNDRVAAIHTQHLQGWTN